MSNQPKNSAAIAGDDYARTAVPPEARKPWLDMAFVWFGAAMVSQLYIAGVGLGITTGGLKNALLAILGGAVFLSLFAALCGWVGAVSHCNAAMVGRYAYGSIGQAIPGFHIADIGWFIVITSVLATLLGVAFPNIDNRIWCILFSMLFISNNYIGFNQMVILNKIAFPVLAITSIYGLYRVGVTLDGGLSAVWDNHYEQTVTMPAAILTVIGTWSAGASRSADYMRFAKKPYHSFLACFLGFFTGFCLCICVGAVFGAATGINDMSGTFVALGMLVPGVIMFFIQNWTSNEHCSYVTSNSIPTSVSVVTRGKVALPRRTVVLAVGFISVIVSGLDIQQYYVPFCAFLGNVIPSIGAVAIGDYFIMSKTKYHWTGHKNYYLMDVESEDVKHHKMNWSAIIALIVGWIVSWRSTFFVPAITGFVATIIVLCVCEMIFYALGFQKKEIAKNEELAKKGIASTGEEAE